jgi:hypothetical protein
MIIDVNIPYAAGKPIAELKADEVDVADRCVDFIDEIRKSKKPFRIALDQGWEIMEEYRRASERAGHQPQLASVFYQNLAQRLNSGAVLEKDFVELVKTPDGLYDPYPRSEALRRFDRADRKFIALAYKHAEHPSIYEGTDCEWWGIRDAMADEGLKVEFLCEEYVIANYSRKYGRKKKL